MITLNANIYSSMKKSYGVSNKDKDENGDEDEHQKLNQSSSTLKRNAANEREMKKRDAKYTRASIVMVVLYIICNTPRVIPNVMEILIAVEEFPFVSANISLTVQYTIH